MCLHTVKSMSGPTKCTITSVHRRRLRTNRLINDLLALSHPLPLGGLNILTWTPLMRLTNVWRPLMHLGLRQVCNRSVDLQTFQGQEEAGFHERRSLAQMLI